jgi:hypothetical protein
MFGGRELPNSKVLMTETSLRYTPNGHSGKQVPMGECSCRPLAVCMCTLKKALEMEMTCHCCIIWQWH